MFPDLSFPNSPLLSLNSAREKLAEQFLRFYLEPDTKVMVSVEQLTEVLTIPLGQIIPIPHMPAWVMGVYNWRGEILWMVDLGHLLGLTPWHQQTTRSPSYKAIVLRSSGESGERSQNLGLVVARVEDIEWCNPEEIQSPPASAVAPGLAPFLWGYWVKPDGDIVVTLNGEAILEAMPKD